MTIESNNANVQIDRFDAEIAAVYQEVWRVEIERDALDVGDRHDSLDLQSRTLREQARTLGEELSTLLESGSWIPLQSMKIAGPRPRVT
jgi:hypothetical protein